MLACRATLVVFLVINDWLLIFWQVTDPYLNLFRGLVPPLLGTIDFTVCQTISVFPGALQCINPVPLYGILFGASRALLLPLYSAT